MSTCATCQHWPPRETPPWAARLGMACCAIKQTKAVTMSHWARCDQHQQASEERVAQRVQFIQRHPSLAEKRGAL
jgi:hypothetical protein